MSRVFVYEYCCAVPRPDLVALRREGRAMLTAALADFARCSTVSTMLDADDEEECFRRLCRANDFALVIAPESGGILEQRCRWAEEEGVRLLGPSSEAVRRTADKLLLAQHLHSFRVPTPPCHPYRPDAAPPFPIPLVCKPRDGAGSQATFLIRDEVEWRLCGEAARAEGFDGELVAQPFIPGTAASVALLVGSAARIVLPAAVQRLSSDGRFHYEGGRIPLNQEAQLRAARLAESVIAAVPGLFGYVGVDIVLGADAVIEINPRLTTSYLGLRALTTGNLAEVMLALAEDRDPPKPGWHPGHVTFSADGSSVTRTP